jgi:hypothetical protein
MAAAAELACAVGGKIGKQLMRRDRAQQCGVQCEHDDRDQRRHVPTFATGQMPNWFST